MAQAIEEELKKLSKLPGAFVLSWTFVAAKLRFYRLYVVHTTPLYRARYRKPALCELRSRK